MKRQRRALVFAGGEPPDPGLAAVLATDVGPDAVVVAADSGAEHARLLGQRVDIAIGDFDSVDPAALRAVEAAGGRVERHPAEKDATDLELALVHAVGLGVTHLTVVGGHGGRADHHAANLLLLCSDRLADVHVDAWMGRAHLVVARTHVAVTGAPGDLVTLLAVGGRATGVTTTGLRYPLQDAVLDPGSTLGVSNELVDRVGEVRVGTGAVLVVVPFALDHRLPEHGTPDPGTPNDQRGAP